MHIRNTIGWQSRWLKKVTRFCSGVLYYKSTCVKKATFRLTYDGAYRGQADLNSHSILVAINPLNSYPLGSRPEHELPELMQADVFEVLVRVTAHEVAHLVRWDFFVRDEVRRGERDTHMERDTDRMAREVLAAFRLDRERLLAKWGESGPGPVHRGVTYQHTCRRCGRIWKRAICPVRPEFHSCLKCFPTWEAAKAAGEFLTYEEIPPPPPPRRGRSSV